MGRTRTQNKLNLITIKLFFMPNKIDKKILENGIKTEDLNLLKQWGEYLSTNNGKDEPAVTTSQIRKFFGEIKRIQADFENNKGDIILLDPKIAYAVGRAEKKTKIKAFYELLSNLIQDINEKKEKFNHFVSVVEAIVAYHKANGGK
jgi:CRISPR-associated protein Csm2